MTVVDASVVVAVLTIDGRRGTDLRRRLRESGELVAPELLDLEVVSSLRGLAIGGKLDPVRADRAVATFRSLAVERFPHRPLLSRIWDLRHNLTAYDAAYVALAEALDAPLVTGDAGMETVPGIRCAVQLMI